MGFGCAFRDAIGAVIYIIAFWKPKITIRSDGTNQQLVLKAKNENSFRNKVAKARFEHKK